MKQSYTTWRNYLLNDDIPFADKAWTVYRHQLEHQPVYRRFSEQLGMNDLKGETIGSGSGKKEHQHPALMSGVVSGYNPDDIPLIPIQIFRDAATRADYVEDADILFKSSGTTDMRQSTHEIADARLYLESCYRGFSKFYNPQDFVILAWLPGYRENPNSSLIAMIDHFIQLDNTGKSRFLPLDKPLNEIELQTETPNNINVRYLNTRRHRRTARLLNAAENADTEAAKNRRLMLFGAAFGLLDLIDAGVPKLPKDAIIVETGGMKTHRREITKEELRQRLADGFGIPPGSVHSEYGMTEMCSQAWDNGKGRFQCPPWLRVTVRNPENPMQVQPSGEEGLIGVMDLANVHSISFFLTQDRGVAWPDGSFQVLGRWDHAELRGCNFLME